MNTKTPFPFRLLLLIAVLIVLPGTLGLAGCPRSPATQPSTGTAPSITGQTVTGTLVQGQPGTITASATVASAGVTSASGFIVSVTADLSAIGGPAAQPLALSQNNLWTFTGSVTPPSGGQQTVTFLATDSAGLTSQATAAVTVTGTGTSTPPTITNASATTPLTVSQSNSVTVTATVTSTSATISAVTADLTAVGGFVGTPLQPQASTDIWTFTTVVVPTTIGTQNIIITAVDSLGTTATAIAPVVVAGSFIPSPVPPPAIIR